MERKPSTTNARARRVLLLNGLAALVFGVACLLVPLFLGGAPSSRALAQALRIPAYVGLALGLLLLGLHAVARRHPRDDEQPRHEPVWQWPRSAVDSQPAAPASPAAWSATVFDEIDPGRFTALCACLFAQAGFDTRVQSFGPDGIDIRLSSRHGHGTVAIARCRHAADRIEAADVRDFHDALAAQGLQRGTYATTSTFGDDAARFAREHRINALDRDRLLAVIAGRTPAQQQELLAIASQGTAATAPCIRTSP